MFFSKIRVSIFFITALFLFSPFSGKTQSLPQGVSIHLLDNGMQVLLIENPALPMVGVNVVVKVGSAYETFASSGMSHMLEHLLFNGTTSRTQKQLYDDTDRAGGYNNANTSEYYTNFMMVTPTENIRQGMEIQADMLFHSTLPEKKFLKEKGIVLEEISKSLADADEQAERNVISVLYNGHALSLPTLGTYATIEHMDRDEVFEFYKNNYVPNNMLMSVIGHFDSARMLKMVRNIYGKEAPGLVYHSAVSGWSTGFDKTHLKAPESGQLFHRFYDGKDPLLECFYELPGKHSVTFFELLDKKLSTIAEKLQESLSDKVKSVHITTRQTPVKSFVQATLKLKHSDENDKPLIAALHKELNNRKNFQFDKEVVEADAAKTRTSFYKNIEKPHMFGIFNAHYIAVNGFEAALDSYSGNDYWPAAKGLNSFTIQAEPIVVFQLPSQKENAETEKTLAKAKLFNHFDSGLTLIARQNKASDLLAIHYLFKHKAPFETKYGKDIAKILHECFGQRMKTEKNQKFSNRFGLTFKVNDNAYLPMDDIYLNPDFGYIRVEGLADDIPGVIGYLNKQMNGFTPTPKEFAKAMAKFSRNNSMRMGSDPAKKQFKQYYKEYLYEASPFDDNAPELTYKNLLSFAREYFQAGNIIVSVVSKATPDSIQTLFSGLSGKPFKKELKPYVKTLQLHSSPITIDEQGGGKRSYLFWGFSKTVNEQDRAALKALSLILADKIIFDIREKQGMAYHMRAGIQETNNRALFYIEQGTRPQNVDVLTSQYPDFFDIKILQDVTKEDLEKSVNMYLGRMMFRRLSSINQGYYLGTSLYFHNDSQYDSDFLKQLKAVKLEDVLRVAKKYMTVKNPVQIVVR